MSEKLDIVNEEDEIIDVKTRKEAHDKGLRHRSVMFFVFNHSGKLLMTQRSENKRFYPAHWSVVLGGHVTSGLSYDDALEKEMEEEIGFVGAYEKIGSFTKEIKEEKENVRLYKVEVDPEKIELSPVEFKRARFIDLDRLEEELDSKDLVPETKQVLEILDDHKD
ncbi:MAG: NUDIX domain-containing protein [Candidatus Thermoplasmatota archaeon]|nr:NUDIX domain-containing protein [Candidatus Thermoplasmatota archaeon]MBS3790322.1 NUDIX domain-containing protein [Candidatus Thermoplasmatota archaeon]